MNYEAKNEKYMITETIYSGDDLKKGKCTCCDEISNEILIGDDRCIDCIEEQAFFEETMKGVYD